MKNNLNRGFTLIELLVVIAIIGILSSVVLASLNTARSKGNDAAIKANLDGLRTQAALYYGENNSNYGADGAGCTGSANLFVLDTTIANQISAADTANSGLSVVCNVGGTGTEYAVSAELVAETGRFYCIDSLGSASTTPTALGAATVCPAS